jgi:hypothetical protein
LAPDARDGLTSYVALVYALEADDRHVAGSRRRPGQIVFAVWNSRMGLPLALLIVQVAGAIATSAHQHGNAAHLGIIDWLLVVLGPRASPASRRGILGMRERATALGGSLGAGPGPTGGFKVTARLPTGGRP